MKPAPFDWFAPREVEEAIALLVEHGLDARPLAGGQSLVPAMNFRLARPEVLVDLNRIASLSEIGVGAEGGLRIGAMTRQAAAERSALVRSRAPLLAESLRHVAHPQIRNRGTVGGSVAHADPSAELPAVLLVLAARLEVRGGSGTRSVAAAEFFTGPFSTALEPGELLVAIEFPPLPSGAGCGFHEVARRHGDFALAGAAAAVTRDPEGRCVAVRLALLGVGGGPVAADGEAAVLVGERPDPRRIGEAARAVAAAIHPPADVHAGPEYRRRLAEVCAGRALAAACRRAAEGGAGATG